MNRATLWVGLTLSSIGIAAAQNTPVTVAIDVSANRHVINPLIYGTGFATTTDLVALGAPLDRRGGNDTTGYNWRQNATNLDADYFYESYPYPSAIAGADADSFIATAQAAKSAPMITIPMMGWVAKLGPNRSILPSFSVAKYGAQCAVDPYDTDAGDGLKPDCSTLITGNDPNDANIKDSPAQEKGWVQHLVKKWGTAAKGGVGYYLTDNEPSIWYSTHRDVHPVGAHATDFRDKVLATAAMIRSVDPTAKIVGPEEWGWEGYFYSGYDQQYSAAHNYNGVFPDRQKEMGGLDYYPWLLQQWKSAHPIDVLSAHFYPQGAEFSDDVSTATQLLRNRSTRQLWDPNYVSESWINAKVMLIPRLKQWVSADYVAGTPVAITEYNWGAEGYINGATTQADIFGIFGREGLDMATRFTVPAASTPTYKAIKMYRNYDGAHSSFGDLSVAASVPNPDDLSAFAAIRQSDGALTVMVIAKQLTGTTKVTLDLAHFTASGTAKVYQLTAANVIKHLASQHWTSGALVATVPAQSITLFVLP
jgi:hypothetical protein